MTYLPRRSVAAKMDRVDPIGSTRSNSRSPGAARDRGFERSQVGDGEREGTLLFRALVRRHQHLDDTDAVVEGEARLLEAEESASEVTVLCLVTVHDRLVGHDRHHPGLGVLL